MSTTESLIDDLVLHTPLIHSLPLSKLCNRNVYLKLDALQPSGSFKDRGMAHLCREILSRSFSSTKPKLISSSGGNAGLAVTTVAQKLDLEVQVIVPKTTKPLVVTKLQTLGASVTIHGENWNAADELARELVEKQDNAIYISPYDDKLLWTGHSTCIDEIVKDTPEEIGSIVASVGGGGLLCGILEGLERHNLDWQVIAAETEGAASFAKAYTSGQHVRLDKIDSIATSLGALQVTSVALERSQQHGKVDACVCTDKQAIEACLLFASHHRLLVEPACGAALAVLYSESLRNDFLSSNSKKAIVVEVCGGSGVNVEMMHAWKEQYDL